MLPSVAVGIVVDNNHNIIIYYYYDATTQCTRGYNEHNNILVKIFTTAGCCTYLLGVKSFLNSRGDRLEGCSYHH